MARIDLGWQNNRRKYKAVYGRTRREVADKLTKTLHAVQQGAALPDERQTVERFLKAWLDHKRDSLRPRAWLTYEQAVRLHLSPGLGKVRLAKLTPAHVERWFREHQQQGASPRNIRYARTVMRAALNQARKWRLVTDNVAALVDPPRHVPRKIQPLDPPQARALLESVKGHRLAALISVATALGLRVGEALGLRWIDVDFDAGTLSVRQALERSGGDVAARRPLIVERRDIRKRLAAAPARSQKRRELRAQLEAVRSKWRDVQTTLRITEPKSASSVRTVTMPNVVVTALKAHRTRQLEERLAAGGEWQDSGLVFTSPIGTALDPRNATRDFPAMLAAAKLPVVRFHDLRHTAATLLLTQGVDPRTIMETLGHSQISLTMNTYSHVLPALQAEAAAKMDAALS
ncbi:MAG TPA: tyrosine-type recombinase/integrase [Vicinamibacterales bacterium]|nr:tyrosine-type recombinase/integrase [Vicinamibacterales bacterium]